MTSHRIFALIASAGAGAAIFSGATPLSPAARAAAPDRYAVIAYSPVTGWTGWANNTTSMEDATHIALGDCQRHGAGCTVASWARNGFMRRYRDVHRASTPGLVHYCSAWLPL
jgi:hypothetical protein